MALCPFAEHQLLPENDTQRAIRPRIIIDHTQAGTGSLRGFWNTSGRGTECHLWVDRSGLIEQYMDTQIQADANLEANQWHEDGIAWGAVSIETENSREATDAYYRRGDHQAFNRDPWTDEQLASLTRVHAWLADTHPDIRRQRCDRPLGSGLGYHSMWGTGPTPWIPYSSRGKECPGRERIRQFSTILLPRFTGGVTPPPPPEKDWFDMATKKDLEDVVAAAVKPLTDALAGAARKAVVVRDPRDRKAWVVTEAGRWHVPSKQALDVLVFVGQVAPYGGQIPVADPAWLDQVPVIDQPDAA